MKVHRRYAHADGCALRVLAPSVVPRQYLRGLISDTLLASHFASQRSHVVVLRVYHTDDV